MAPSAEFVSKHWRLANEYLEDAAHNLQEGRLRTALDRAYYAMHFAALAVLMHLGVKPPKSHRGLVVLFTKEVVDKGLISRAFSRQLAHALDDRQDATYDADAEITEDQTRQTVATAEQFLQEAQRIIG